MKEQTTDSAVLAAQSVPESVSRRQFLHTMGGLALGSAAVGLLPAEAQTAVKKPQAETLVKILFESLTPKQRETICMPWEHAKRSMVGANWAIVKPTISEIFTADQQKMIEGILRGVTSELRILLIGNAAPAVSSESSAFQVAKPSSLSGSSRIMASMPSGWAAGTMYVPSTRAV